MELLKLLHLTRRNKYVNVSEANCGFQNLLFSYNSNPLSSPTFLSPPATLCLLCQALPLALILPFSPSLLLLPSHSFFNQLLLSALLSLLIQLITSSIQPSSPQHPNIPVITVFSGFITQIIPSSCDIFVKPNEFTLFLSDLKYLPLEISKKKILIRNLNPPSFSATCYTFRSHKLH